MKRHPRRDLPAVVGLILFALLAPSASSAGSPITPSNSWRGSVEDVALMERAPTVIAAPEALRRIWEQWQAPGAPPVIDFRREILVVVTTRGSQLRPVLELEENGNLTVNAIATRDLRPGFRYVIAAVPRAGVRSVNGERLDPIPGGTGGNRQETVLAFQTRNYRVRVYRLPRRSARMDLYNKRTGRYVLRGNPATRRVGRGYVEYRASRSGSPPPAGTEYIARSEDSGHKSLLIRTRRNRTGTTESAAP